MRPSKLFSSLVCLLGLAAHVGYAQDSTSDFLNAHSAERSQVGVPPVAWNETVAAFARNHANHCKGDCQLLHSGPPYGENLSGKLTGVDAVKLSGTLLRLFCCLNEALHQK
ncbi:Pathogenesis-related protein 1 [Spatholobus suberectus]|nr:Pathogenesis-related protein 1 [Spatholobus suberectus]